MARAGSKQGSSGISEIKVSLFGGVFWELGNKLAVFAVKHQGGFSATFGWLIVWLLPCCYAQISSSSKRNI